jgi:predicted ABC-type ATPase
MPNLYIIAGCNGAGKTTASFTILPEMLNCKEFVNPDEIARGLSPFQPEHVAIEAGKIMLKRIHELIKSKIDFAFETTLSARHYKNLINEAHKMGYFVTLVFFWLNGMDLAIQRVKMRVSQGGHDIPEDTIKKRYHSGIKNLINLYIPVCDYWVIINNSLKPRQVVAHGEFSNVTEINEPEIWNEIKRQGHE